MAESGTSKRNSRIRSAPKADIRAAGINARRRAGESDVEIARDLGLSTRRLRVIAGSRREATRARVSAAPPAPPHDPPEPTDGARRAARSAGAASTGEARRDRRGRFGGTARGRILRPIICNWNFNPVDGVGDTLLGSSTPPDSMPGARLVGSATIDLGQRRATDVYAERDRDAALQAAISEAQATINAGEADVVEVRDARGRALARVEAQG
jgi:hypothetical protein